MIAKDLIPTPGTKAFAIMERQLKCGQRIGFQREPAIPGP
jgi:hypothetical protein